MTRVQKILSALLGVQVVIALIVFWPRSTAIAESGPLFADFIPDEVTTVTVTDNNDVTIKLARLGDGWVLPDAGNYPADGTKIEPLLEKIAAIQTGRLVARSSDSHERLQVADDDYARRVVMEMGDGSTQTLFVGSSPNPSGTHVRRSGQDETFLTGDVALWEVTTSTSNWIDTSYISLNREEIVSIVLENGNGTFEFEKGPTGEWSLQGLSEEEEFEPALFNTLLNRIVNLNMLAPLGTVEKPEYGLDTPQATLTVITESSEDQSTQFHTLLVGAQDPDDDNFIVKWSDSDYIVKVSSFSLENMVNHVRDEFIKEPPTPTPQSEEGTPAEVTSTPSP